MRSIKIIVLAVSLLAALTVSGCGPAHVDPVELNTTPESTPPRALSVVERTVTDGVTVAKLSNGLTVIVQSRSTTPIVCVQSFVRAGSMYEREWLGCGLSHLVEHLVAKGAVHPGKQSSGKTVQTRNRVAEIGGQSNAYTSSQQTSYFITAASGKTMECIDLIADWMARPDILRKDFEREHGVVPRELEKGLEEAGRQMGYAQMSNLYGSHPVAVPVIGYAKPLSKVTYEDVLAYHKRMYVPQNMLFVVVGDVDPQKVIERTCETFAGFDAGRTPEHPLPPVRPIVGIRRVTRAQVGLKQAIVSLAFPTIDLLHEDLYALDLLAYVVANGRSSRLHNELYRKQNLVTEISGGSWTPAWGKGAFFLRYRSEVADAEKAEKAILKQLRKIIDEGVTKAELDRAKRQKVADQVKSQQTVQSITRTLASDYRSTGDIMFSRNYTSRIQAVTAEEVRQAARKYFTFDKIVITTLVPELSDESTGDNLKSTTEDKQAFRLKGGLQVILQPVSSAGLVSMAYTTPGGLRMETKKTNGLGLMMGSMTTRGTKSYSAEQIDEFFDRAGGSISARSGGSSAFWQATVLEDSFDEGMDIFAEVITQPNFTQKELDLLRTKSLAAIEKADEGWFQQLNRYFRSGFYAQTPYGLARVGSEEVVKNTTLDDIRSHHKNIVLSGSHNSVLAVYGSFDAEKLRGRLEELFPPNVDPSDTPMITLTDDSSPLKKDELHVLTTKKKIGAVMVAVPGMRLTNHKDRFAMDVLDTIISGYRMPGGWMHTELRGKKLVYVVHSFNQAGVGQSGAFATYAAGQPEKLAEIVAIIKKNMRRASSYKPTQKEIDIAVNTILTAELLGSQSMSDLAISAALDEMYGLGHDFRRKLEKHYRSVTPDEVLRVGRKYLSGGFAVYATTPQPEVLDSSNIKNNDRREVCRRNRTFCHCRLEILLKQQQPKPPPPAAAPLRALSVRWPLRWAK